MGSVELLSHSLVERLFRDVSDKELRFKIVDNYTLKTRPLKRKKMKLVGTR